MWYRYIQGRISFQVCDNRARIDALRQQISDIEAYIYFTETDPENEMYVMLWNKTESELADLAFRNLSENSGPVSCSLSPILEKHHVTSRPYHGGAFTGNHCHKYVSSKVYARLTDEIVRQAKLHTSPHTVSLLTRQSLSRPCLMTLMSVFIMCIHHFHTQNASIHRQYRKFNNT